MGNLLQLPDQKQIACDNDANFLANVYDTVYEKNTDYFRTLGFDVSEITDPNREAATKRINIKIDDANNVEINYITPKQKSIDIIDKNEIPEEVLELNKKNGGNQLLTVNIGNQNKIWSKQTNDDNLLGIECYVPNKNCECTSIIEGLPLLTTRNSRLPDPITIFPKIKSAMKTG